MFVNGHRRPLLACLLLALAACGSESGVPDVGGSDPRAIAFAEWLASAPLVRRGGDGKIDSEVLAVAVTAAPSSDGAGFEEEEHLVVWARFEHLDPTWAWDTEVQPVWVTVEPRGGEPLREVSARVDPQGKSRSLMGAEAPPKTSVAGSTFAHVALFERPPAGTEELIVRTFTRRPDVGDFELVAVLLPMSRVTGLDLDR